MWYKVCFQIHVIIFQYFILEVQVVVIWSKKYCTEGSTNRKHLFPCLLGAGIVVELLKGI